MDSENVKDANLLSTMKEKPMSDHISDYVCNEGILVITIDSDYEEMDTVVDFSVKTENDSEVIYISDYEYDSDYEYRRKTNKPGPKSKTRHKLSQDEKEKARARYGNKRPRLDIQSADKEDFNTIYSFIKNDGSEMPSDPFDKEVKKKVLEGNNYCKSDVRDTDILFIEDSNDKDICYDLTEVTFTHIGVQNEEMKKSDEEASIKEGISVSLAVKNEKLENVDEDDSKSEMNPIQKHETLKISNQAKYTAKEKSLSTSVGTDFDSKPKLDQIIIEKDDTAMPLIEKDEIMNTNKQDNNAEKEIPLMEAKEQSPSTSPDVDICLEADLQKNAIKEDPK